MPAVSKAQQRFFGMVRAAQKGKMAAPSAEVSQAASSMSRTDVKKFAKTKHKGLPNKVKVKEAYYGGEEQRKKDERKAAYEKQLKKMLPKRAFDQMGRELDPRSGKLKEESCGDGKYYCHTDKKCKPIPEGSKVDKNGMLFKDEDLEEATSYFKSDPKYQKKLADDDKKHKEQDRRMKFGKFYKKAKDARDTLRPGEVKRYDKTLGKWVSNKD